VIRESSPRQGHTLSKVQPPKDTKTQKYQRTRVAHTLNNARLKTGLAQNGDKACLTEALCRSKARRDTSPKGVVDQISLTFTATQRMNYPTRSDSTEGAAKLHEICFLYWLLLKVDLTVHRARESVSLIPHTRPQYLPIKQKRQRKNNTINERKKRAPRGRSQHPPAQVARHRAREPRAEGLPAS